MNNLEIPGIFSPHFQVKHLSDCQFVCLGSGLSDSLKHGKQYHSIQVLLSPLQCLETEFNKFIC